MVWCARSTARWRRRLHCSSGIPHRTLSLRLDDLVGATAADGGLVADGLMEHLDDEAWNTFQWDFIAPETWHGEHRSLLEPMLSA
jgi:hypothetical protein